MLKKILSTLFALSLSSLLNGCASTPDVPVCLELGMDRGYCIHTISNREFEVNDKRPYYDPISKTNYTWWELRPLMVHLPAASWVEIKAFIIKMCKRNNQCGSEITSWERTVETMDRVMKEQGVLP